MTVPQIFNHDLLKKRQMRWQSDAVADVLTTLVRQYLDRLADFNRTFERALIWGDLSKQIAHQLPDNMVIEAVGGAYEPSLEACGGVASNSFDLVLSFGLLQWVNDVPGLLGLWRQLLKQDGLLMTCFVGGQSLYELGYSLQKAELEVLGGASGRVGPMIDAADYGQLLQRAGYALPVVDTDRITLSYDCFADLMQDVRRLGCGNVAKRQWQALTPPSVFRKAEEIYQQEFCQKGEWPLTIELVHGAAWSPAANQQKALPVGSAKKRLADALDVQELSTDDKAKP